MAARYVKNHSNYLLRKRHQDTTVGRIFEKDWVTIGSKERYYSRDKKKSYHGDSNFVFTTTNIPSYQKKFNNGDFIADWKYDDVKNARPIVNQVIRNYRTNDIRSFAYYGSATELVRASIEGIISTFPPYLTVSNVELGDWKFEDEDCLIINNPFFLDLCTKDIKLSQYEDAGHYLWLSWENFIYTNDGINYTELLESPVIEYIWKPKGNETRPCHDIELLWRVTIGDVVLLGVHYYDHLVFVTEKKNLKFQLMPKKEYVESYFDTLEGFESCLLNRTSKPYYSNSFLTPYRTDYGTVDTYKNYTWPSDYFTYNGYEFYPIDITSPTYNEFVLSMIENASILDETYSDNIWNKMVHEAIKNYDWSYSRFRDEDLEEQHYIGGNQVEKLLRVVGRGMDDILNMSDGIKAVTNITYDGRNNVTDAELSDKLDLKGWETYSTISDGNADVELGTELDYGGYTTSHITSADVDNEFMRRFNLVSSRILSSKGTIESIDMVMALFGLSRWNGDYTITEEYRTVEPITEENAKNLGLDLAENEEYDDLKSELNRLNGKKYDMVLYYDDDPYSGIPLKEIYAQNDKMLVPYYDHHKFYDGEMYFQFNGGWGEKNNIDKESLKDHTYDEIIRKRYRHEETMTYMQVFENCHSVLSTPNGIKEGEIVYINNMSDYREVFNSENSCMPTDHYMICIDTDASTSTEGWELVDETHEAHDRAVYIDSLRYDNKGNNPHVGFGDYDMGELYWEYMRKPFKYAYDNKRLYSLTDDLINTYDRNLFTIDDESIEVVHDDTDESFYYLRNDSAEKIYKKEMTEDGLYVMKGIDDIEITDEMYHNHSFDVFISEVDENGNNVNVLYNAVKPKTPQKHTLLNDYYKDNAVEYRQKRYEKEKTEYVLNSKVLIITNGIKNDFYRDYFNKVILKYLMQVIPSTTILSLKDFEIIGK